MANTTYRKSVMDIYDSRAEQYDRYTKRSFLTILYNLFKKRLMNRKQDGFYLNLGSGISYGLDTEEKVSVCLDISKESLIMSKRHSHNSLFVVADSSTVPFKDCSFGLVVSFDLFEHVDDKEGLSSEVFRVLKPGGKLTLTTPNHKMELVIKMLDRLRLKFPEGPHSYSTSRDLRSYFKEFAEVNVSRFFFGTQFLVRATK